MATTRATTTRTRSIDRNLKAEGYQFIPSQLRPELYTFLKPDGTTYQVDLAKNTCTCQAGQHGRACCHVREADTHARTIRFNALLAQSTNGRLVSDEQRKADWG